MLNTLVHNQPVNKGLHWAMFVPTLVALYEYKGTPCVQQKIKSIKHHLTTRGLEH